MDSRRFQVGPRGLVPWGRVVLHRLGPRYSFTFRLPQRIILCRSRDDLAVLLTHFSHPFIRHRTPDDPGARRFHVEQVRPALRFYCKAFGVAIPAWLRGNAHFEQLYPAEHEETFGPGPLRVREFCALRPGVSGEGSTKRTRRGARPPDQPSPLGRGRRTSR